MTVEEHAAQMAALLASEWRATGYVRSWHAQYRYDGQLYHAMLVQTRHVAGFQVALVGRRSIVDLQSQGTISIRAACVWLGLDDVREPLDWHHEL